MARDVLSFAEELTVRTDECEIILGEYMRSHTSFRIGGTAEIFCRPRSEEALLLCLEQARQQDFPVTVLGAGSNVLVGDRGIRGVVLDMTGLSDLRQEGNRLIAQAGTLLTVLSRRAAEAGLSGLEFASGIPGTLGGGIFMDAGAYGGAMEQVVKSARVLGRDGWIRELEAAELELSYRHSRLMETGELLLSAELELVPGDREEILARMREFNEKRREKQPLELPSAGSTFKRPAGDFAGRLIEASGLKGFAMGRAAVSAKHAGFVVNLGGASAAEVLALCREVQARVKADSGVELELEVQLLGEF